MVEENMPAEEDSPDSVGMNMAVEEDILARDSLVGEVVADTDSMVSLRPAAEDKAEAGPPGSYFDHTDKQEVGHRTGTVVPCLRQSEYQSVESR
jgi:hypothetical protein